MKLESILDAMEWFANKIVKYLMILLLVVVGMNIFFRYVLSNSLSWAEETARYLLIWITFIGATTMMRRKEHYNVNLFKEETLLKNILRVLYRVGFLVLGTLMLVQGGLYTARMAYQLAPATRVSMALVYIVIPIAGIYFIIYSLTEKFK